MEHGDCRGAATRRNHKRKFSEAYNHGVVAGDDSFFSLDDLNQDLLEKVLSWLPTSAFYRATSVCKRWKSVADSTTFKLACCHVPSRDPWCFMVESSALSDEPPVIYDSSDNSWKTLPLPRRDLTPVAAAGALICFLNAPEGFVVCNPATGSCRGVACPGGDEDGLLAIAMVSNSSDSYKIVLISSETLDLSFRVYHSETHQWGERVMLRRKTALENENDITNNDSAVYFLSKCGDVVSTNLQRTPCKRYSSVFVEKDGEEIVYFLSPMGAVIVCNLTAKRVYENPRLLPVHSEYSIDLVGCGGEVYAVVLSEFLVSASLRVWWYDESAQCWRQVAAMPPCLSHEFYGKKLDVNCTASGNEILVCLSSAEIFRQFHCDLGANQWVELSQCYAAEGDMVKEFVSAFSVQPRIEAAV